MKKFSTMFLFVTILIVVFVACDNLADEVVNDNSSEIRSSYIDISNYDSPPRWPDPSNIPVCWEPLDEKNQLQEESIIQPTSKNKFHIARVVKNQYARAGIRFTGWRSCSRRRWSKDRGIRIKIIYSYGSSKTKGFGTEIDGMENGMVLNWYTPETDIEIQNKYFNRIINTALHEFGHAIGLHHEMSRPDNTECLANDYTMGYGETKNVQSMGDYISKSIMSYCRNFYSTELSDADIEGIKNYYNNPIATIVNGPRGVNNFSQYTFNIGGYEIDGYRYKIGNDESIDCNDPSGYSEEMEIQNPIDENLLPLGDGAIKLCVVGKDKRGAWQDFKAYTSWYWKQDLTPPSPGIINKSEDKAKLKLYLDNDDVRIVRYKSGIDLDCKDPSGYSDPKEYKQVGFIFGETTVITLPIKIDVPTEAVNYKVCIVAKDQAGNEQSYIDASEFIYPEE